MKDPSDRMVALVSGCQVGAEGGQRKHSLQLSGVVGIAA